MTNRVAAWIAVCMLAALGCSPAAGRPGAPTIWLANDVLSPQAREVLDVLADAAVYGLDPQDYVLRLSPRDLDVLRTGRVEASAQEAADTELTNALLRFVHDVHAGRIDPRTAGFDLPREDPSFDARGLVRELASADDVLAVIASIEPRARPYSLLKQALARYRKLAQQPQLSSPLPRIEDSLSAGDAYTGAAQLRRLLAALGDLDASAAARPSDSTLIDAQLAQAVQRFQRRHGLEADGVIGRRTYAELAVPLASRVRQIELTLERWRWTTALDRPDIVVHIPQFMLYALPPRGADASRALEMPIIVGRNAPHMRTPVFTATIERVVFQPFWDVPRGILEREILPLIRRDVRYLERNDMEIVRGSGDDASVVTPTPDAIEALELGELRLRQRPGAKNALGSVKFVAPNPYSVFLHATPAAELFGRSRRAFSHGCIRVSEPAQLAEYVLKNAPERWTADAIEAAMCGSQTQTVTLRKPVRVLVFYGTAAATESEGVLFAADLYGEDAKLEQLLRARAAGR